MKQFLKSVLRGTPYRIIRAREANRFQAIEETLRSLHNRGYVPQLLIDGGANVGDFTKVARRVFGRHFDIHLFEPQPACLPALEAFTTRDRRLKLHAAALGSSSDQELYLAVDPNAVTTGAHVAIPNVDIGTNIAVPVETLDDAFGETLIKAQRSLLKLDLQGWEMEALNGARRILSSVELVLIEVSFFAQAYEPPISTIVRFFDDAGFDRHDIASITGRDRDNRARQADFLFAARWSSLKKDTAWA